MRYLSSILLLAIVLTTGCATDYMTDRWRDTLDMATCTFNSSIGIRERVGPFSGGLYAGVELAGLRGGECKVMDTSDGYDKVCDVDLTLAAREMFMPKNFEIARARGKLYEAKGIMTVVILSDMDGEDHSWLRYIPYYTDAQASFGLLVGMRVGLNLGEVVDWLCGWCLIDIFDDDIGAGDPYTSYINDYRKRILKNVREDQKDEESSKKSSDPLEPPKEPVKQEKPEELETPKKQEKQETTPLLPDPSLQGFRPIGK